MPYTIQEEGGGGGGGGPNSENKNLIRSEAKLLTENNTVR